MLGDLPRIESRLEVVECLVQHNVDINAKDKVYSMLVDSQIVFTGMSIAWEHTTTLFISAWKSLCRQSIG